MSSPTYPKIPSYPQKFSGLTPAVMALYGLFETLIITNFGRESASLGLMVGLLLS